MKSSEESENHTNSKMQGLLDEQGWRIASFKHGDIVEGTVVAKGKNELLVDIGGKSEGIIVGKELEDSYRTFKNINLGDKVLTYVIHGEDEQGYVVLSLRRAETERRWLELTRSLSDEIALTVRVVDYNKGGLLVDIGNLRGFIPISHIDRAHFPESSTRAAVGSYVIRDEALGSLIGEELQARVIELDRRNNRLILSEKLASTGKTSEQQREAFSAIKVGDVLKGTVTAVLPFGMFVDVNGLEGLVHISEMSWGKVTDPNELFVKGQEVDVKVTEIDAEGNKISLSVKSLQADPWQGSDTRYQVGKFVEGTVTKVTPYGAFVRMEEGMDGLIHVSETVGPLQEGEKIKARIVSFDPSQRKLGLSLKPAPAE